MVVKSFDQYGLQYGFITTQSNIPLITAQQVHRASWIWLPEGKPTPTSKIKADALATQLPGQAIGVYSADCVPVLLCVLGAQKQPLAVAAIHAGWRGTAQGIVGRVTQALLGLLSQPAHVVAAIGPCIRQPSFEVGEEVPAAFSLEQQRKFSQFLRKNGVNKYLFDLVGSNQEQLEEAWSKHHCTGELTILPQCSFTETNLPSFRRDGKKAGRILSYIALPQT